VTPSTTPRRPPSMRDVARLAGVSYQTVSRVLNDMPDVAPTTRAKVLAATDQLSYRRNLNARNLVTNRSATIGIVTDDSPRLGPVSTLMALEKVARQQGRTCAVATIAEPYTETVPHAFLGLEELGVHGIVVIATVVSVAEAVRTCRVRVPLVLIAAGEERVPGVVAYAENQELGARIATQHLLRLGHTDIVHVAGSQDWFDGRVRLRGFHAEMTDAGFSDPRWYESNWTPKFAYDLGNRLAVEGLPSAIFAASDHMALGLLRALAERGIRVPKDVSVVGYDDAEGSDFFYPPLTTVRQDFAWLATRSLELLDQPMRNPFEDEPPIAPILRVRQSTGPARVEPL
jgi:DNA-binding LacI/PurR family transcriptional regulator